MFVKVENIYMSSKKKIVKELIVSRNAVVCYLIEEIKN